ncbi:hypothetical protein QVD17_21124 [Tagetes erecta]|uniref:Transmembrane protein n=1 Tax=Tagetes erecta TaxID=13708 RepID=A0AAD8KR55_TARER|nr:hypothetical protein QVD17_21124 [Tagetes erecta]
MEPTPQSLHSSQIFTQTMRILISNPTTFIAISTILIYPVSSLHLSNPLIDQSIVKTIAQSLLFIANSSGLQSIPFMNQSCHKLSEILISSVVNFPLYCTLLLVSKAAVVYSVNCTYSRKKFVSIKFFLLMKSIWRRIVSTYFLICVLIVFCFTLFFILLLCFSKMLLAIGFSPDSIACVVVITVLLFLVLLAHVIIICDLCMVIAMWEDVSGFQALMRSSVLIRGQTRVGLMVFVGSTIGMGVVKGLFEHRVKVLSYGDASLRIWERPVLVLVYSFVVLVDFMMSTVFFFSCKSYGLEAVECGM